jgi:hypothetical protein
VGIGGERGGGVGGGSGHEGQPLDLSQARVRMQVLFFSMCWCLFSPLVDGLVIYFFPPLFSIFPPLLADGPVTVDMAAHAGMATCQVSVLAGYMSVSMPGTDMPCQSVPMHCWFAMLAVFDFVCVYFYYACLCFFCCSWACNLLVLRILLAGKAKMTKKNTLRILL